MAQNDPKKMLSAKQEKVAAAVAADELSDEAISQKFKIGRKTLQRWKALPDFAARVLELVEAVRLAVREKSIANKEHRVNALIDRQRRMHQVITERAEWYEMNKPGVPGGKSGMLVNSIKFVKVYEVDQHSITAATQDWEPKIGDEVEVLDKGLSKLRRLCPGSPPNHLGVIEEVHEDGSLLILFDDTKQAAPYPKHLVRPRRSEDDEVFYPTKNVQPVDDHAVDTALLKEMRETEKQLAIELGEWTEKQQQVGTSVTVDLSQLDTDEKLDLYERHLDAGVEPERAFLLARKGKATATS